MEGMERKLPASIDYSAVLPMSVPAESRRRKFYPVNGGTFTSTGNSEIRIPISSTNALLDAAHSYLTFTLTNNNAGATFSPDLGGAAMMFSRVRVEQQGKVLSDTNEYNRLVASVINPVSETRDGRLAATIRDLTRAGNFPGVPNTTPGAAGTYRGDKAAFACHNSPLMIDNTAAAANGSGSFTFTMPLITGLFTQDKLIPLPLVDKNNPITIVLTMDDVVNMGVFAGVAPAAGSLSITAISYNAQLVEVGPDVISQFAMMRDMMGGQLALSGHDWEHNSAFLEGDAAGGGGERIVPIPMRKRSIKSLFWVANSSDLANTAGPLAGLHLVYNKSFGGTCNIDSYQLKVGSVVYPPTAIAGPGQSVLARSQTRRGECLMELCKAMGTLSFSAPSGALLNTLTYMADQGSAVGATTADGDNGDGLGATLVPDGADAACVCPFGLDLEAFQHTALESGVDTETLALQSNLILNIDPLAGNIGIESKTIHSWICYDKHYYFNQDGSVSFSD